MEKLSVVIIALNEARNIGRALASVSSVADEIVVVDGFSTDNTPSLCRSAGARLIQHKWMGYAATKNWANQQATFSWILSIDADEALSERLIASISHQKSVGFTGAYVLSRLTNYCGKWIRHSTWYPDKKVRIFPKTHAQWEGEYVHETLRFAHRTPLAVLSGHLYHYSYYTRREHRLKADHYSQLTARKLHAAGKKASYLKPYFSAIGRFVAMFLLHGGFLDGRAGYDIARISAQSNILKYKTLRKLHKVKAQSCR